MRTHGHWRGGRPSPTYHSWKAMWDRCTLASNYGFPNYGGRGVTICERWSKFENFLADMGERPAGKTLDRKDSNGEYSPANCRWATRVEQARNQRNNVNLTHNGKTQCVSAWAKDAGISYQLFQQRIAKGWPMERALQPPRAYTKARR